jgi:hypothetical protein
LCLFEKITAKASGKIIRIADSLYPLKNIPKNADSQYLSFFIFINKIKERTIKLISVYEYTAYAVSGEKTIVPIRKYFRSA